jgi:hypothetical protein
MVAGKKISPEHELAMIEAYLAGASMQKAGGSRVKLLSKGLANHQRRKND